MSGNLISHLNLGDNMIYENRDKVESVVFNQMASFYDKYRPDYPKEVLKTITELAGLNKNSKILEIGCGSGKYTKELIEKGYEVVALDPGEDLITKAKVTYKQGKVKFVNSRFEDYSIESDTYDIIVSAQAFHWVEKPKGFELCSKALKSDGWLMPFWNIELIEETELDKDLFKIIEKYSAHVSTMKSKDYYESRVPRISNEIEQSNFFAKPKLYQFYWTKKYTAEEYFGYCMTANFFGSNSEEMKRLCFEELKQLESKYSGIKRNYVCELYATKVLK